MVFPTVSANGPLTGTHLSHSMTTTCLRRARRFPARCPDTGGGPAAPPGRGAPAQAPLLAALHFPFLLLALTLPETFARALCAPSPPSSRCSGCRLCHSRGLGLHTGEQEAEGCGPRSAQTSWQREAQSRARSRCPGQGPGPWDAAPERARKAAGPRPSVTAAAVCACGACKVGRGGEEAGSVTPQGQAGPGPVTGSGGPNWAISSPETQSGETDFALGPGTSSRDTVINGPSP